MDPPNRTQKRSGPRRRQRRRGSASLAAGCLVLAAAATSSTAEAACEAGNGLTLSINFDGYPTETAWKVTATDGTVADSGSGITYQPGSTHDFAMCLPDGDYAFAITDSYGDGICCGYGIGGYSLKSADGSVDFVSSGDFGDQEVVPLSFVPPTASPTASPDGPGPRDGDGADRTAPDYCTSADFELPATLMGAYGAAFPPGQGPPPQTFATVAALKGGWTPGLAMYETPMAVRFTHLIDMLDWNCAASYSADWKDAIDRGEPLVRTPGTVQVADADGAVSALNIHSSDARLLCMVHGWATVVLDWVPEAYPSLSGVQYSLGYRGIVPGYNSTVDEAFDLATGDPDRAALGTLAEGSCYSPRTMGAIIGRQLTEYAKRDGWNMYGELSNDGTPCTANCRRYADPTGYYSVYRWGANGDQKHRWRPLLENDGRGYETRQQHVAPHIGFTASRRLLTDEDYLGRSVPDPEYDYDTEARLVTDRLRATAGNDMTKVTIEFFNDKIQVAFAVIASVASHGASFEQILNYVVGLTASEYDATLLAWREKVHHDLIRPTTWIQEEMGEEDFDTYAGPYQGSQNIKGKNFESYVRVMPHSEYVSGSGCICTAMAQFTDAWMEATDGQLAPPGMAPFTFTSGNSIPIPVANDNPPGAPGAREPPFVQGSSKSEPGVTPASDITLMYPTMTALRDACGQTRLDGGMHFTDSVARSYELCDGIGDVGATYSMELMGQ